MNKKKEFNFLIVDDNNDIIQKLECILSTKYNQKLHKTFDYTEALDILRNFKIDLFFLNLNINGQIDLTIIDEINFIQPKVKIIIFSAFNKFNFNLQNYEKMVHFYLNKNISENEIFEVIDNVLNSTKTLTIKTNNSSKKSTHINLSLREKQVAKLLVKGFKNIEISNALNLTMTTISTYKKRIYLKLKVENLIQLAKVHKNLYE